MKTLSRPSVWKLNPGMWLGLSRNDLPNAWRGPMPQSTRMGQQLEKVLLFTSIFLRMVGLWKEDFWPALMAACQVDLGKAMPTNAIQGHHGGHGEDGLWWNSEKHAHNIRTFSYFHFSGGRKILNAPDIRRYINSKYLFLDFILPHKI